MLAKESFEWGYRLVDGIYKGDAALARNSAVRLRHLADKVLEHNDRSSKGRAHVWSYLFASFYSKYPGDLEGAWTYYQYLCDKYESLQKGQEDDR